MLEKIRNSKDSKLAKVILVIIIIPFALFGIDSYLSSITTNNYVAKVNGQELSLQQYQRTEDIIRQQMTDANTDPSLFESNQFRQAVVDNMVSTELISQAINDYGFSISDEQLRDYIVGMPDFQVNGKFSQDRYDEIVRYNNISPKVLEEKIRNDLAGQQIRDSLNNLIYTPDEVIQPLVNLAYQKRDISLYEIYLDDYKDKIKLTDDQMKKFYEDNKTSFTRPDQVKIEFIIYSVAGLVPKTVITDEEVKEFYTANKDSFQSNQERKAKHILFAFKSDLTDSDKAKLKQKAQKTLQAVKKDPKTFEAKAKELSQDPESAKRGGDLGFFAR
jgi:peptidyl-prolyl cis-trans isomerase D